MIKENILERLYVRKKLSMMEISSKLDVNVRQVDYWLRKYNIKARSISEAIYQKCNKDGDPFKIPKFVKNKNIHKNKNFLYGLGLGLYWGEGTKRDKNSVRLGNSDPKLIKKFIKFLTMIFNIETKKLKFGLQIFSDINKQEALNYWTKILNVKEDKFQKVIVTKSGKLGTYRYKSKYGVLTVYFNNTKLRDFIFEKIIKL